MWRRKVAGGVLRVAIERAHVLGGTLTGAVTLAAAGDPPMLNGDPRRLPANAEPSPAADHDPSGLAAGRVHGIAAGRARDCSPPAVTASTSWLASLDAKHEFASGGARRAHRHRSRGSSQRPDLGEPPPVSATEGCPVQRDDRRSTQLTATADDRAGGACASSGFQLHRPGRGAGGIRAGRSRAWGLQPQPRAEAWRRRQRAHRRAAGAGRRADHLDRPRHGDELTSDRSGGFLKSADPEGGGERSRRHALGVDREHQGRQWFAPAARALLQRIPKFRLQRDAGAMPGDAEAPFDQHAVSPMDHRDREVNIPKRLCRRRRHGCMSALA